MHHNLSSKNLIAVYKLEFIIQMLVDPLDWFLGWIFCRFYHSRLDPLSEHQKSVLIYTFWVELFIVIWTISSSNKTKIRCYQTKSIAGQKLCFASNETSSNSSRCDCRSGSKFKDKRSPKHHLKSTKFRTRRHAFIFICWRSYYKLSSVITIWMLNILCCRGSFFASIAWSISF